MTASAAYGFVDQSAPAAVVKAAFLINFAKFTDWPQLPDGSPLVYCVVGDDAVAAALTNTAVRNQHIAGHSLRVRTDVDASTWHSCHVLFIGEGEQRRQSDGLALLKTLPVLTTSDATGFAQRGEGIAELYLEGGRMRVAINVDAAERAGLRVSSRLLSLAKVVRTAGVR